MLIEVTSLRSLALVSHPSVSLPPLKTPVMHFFPSRPCSERLISPHAPLLPSPGAGEQFLLHPVCRPRSLPHSLSFPYRSTPHAAPSVSQSVPFMVFPRPLHSHVKQGFPICRVPKLFLSAFLFLMCISLSFVFLLLVIVLKKIVFFYAFCVIKPLYNLL